MKTIGLVIRKQPVKRPEPKESAKDGKKEA